MAQFLGTGKDSTFVTAIIGEADVNGDGGLELEEFTELMMKILITSERNK